MNFQASFVNTIIKTFFFRFFLLITFYLSIRPSFFADTERLFSYIHVSRSPFVPLHGLVDLFVVCDGNLSWSGVPPLAVIQLPSLRRSLPSQSILWRCPLTWSFSRRFFFKLGARGSPFLLTKAQRVQVTGCYLTFPVLSRFLGSHAFFLSMYCFLSQSVSSVALCIGYHIYRSFSLSPGALSRLSHFPSSSCIFPCSLYVLSHSLSLLSHLSSLEAPDPVSSRTDRWLHKYSYAITMYSCYSQRL